MRRLTDEQIQFKQVVLQLARLVYSKNTALLNEYEDADSWRLIRVDDDIECGRQAFKLGDMTIAHKKEGLGAAVPRIDAFSWRMHSQIALRITDPIEFLED